MSRRAALAANLVAAADLVRVGAPLLAVSLVVVGYALCYALSFVFDLLVGRYL